MTQCFLGWVQELALTPQPDGWFVGKVRNYPVGIEAIDPEGENGLFLIQVRHPLSEAESNARAVLFSEKINEMIADGALEISFEEKLVWISFNKAPARVAEGALSPLFEAILDALSQAGFAEKVDHCHYCREKPVNEPTFANGKIGLICPDCISDKKRGKKKERDQMGWRLFSPWLTVSLAAVVGASVWFVFWCLWDWFFDVMHSSTIVIPRLLVIILMVGIGLGVGGPVAWVINRYSFQGRKLPLVLGLIATAIGVLAGEFLHVIWLVFRELKIISVQAAWAVWWPVEAESSGFYLLYKLGALAMSLCIAYIVIKEHHAPDVKL